MDITLLYLLGLILFALFLKYISRKRKFWGALFSFLFTTVVTLAVVELLYRAFLKKTPIIESGNFGGSMNQLNSTYGFTVKDIPVIEHYKVTKDGDTVYNSRYSIMHDTGFNKQTINHRIGFLPQHDSSGSELVFLGCSFTFGSGINDTATLPYIAGELSNLPSLNLGGSGWGTHHTYQLFANKYCDVPDSTKRVFVYSFIPDHVIRAKCVYSWSLNDPYFKVEGDSLKLQGSAYKNSSYARWHVITRILSLNRIFTFISDIGNVITTGMGTKNVNEEDYKRVALMMERINTVIKARGDRFIIVHWNDYKPLAPKEEPPVSKEKMAAVFTQLQAHGAEIVNVSDIIDFNDPGVVIAKDNHPSGKANRQIATRLVQLIRP